MADTKDNKPDEKGAKPALTASSSLDKPLLDDEAVKETADIDTSHLTLDDSSPKTGGSLEIEREENAPPIKTSHLSLENETESAAAKQAESSAGQTAAPVNEQQIADKELTDTSPASSEEEGALVIENPYVNTAGSDTAADTSNPPSEKSMGDEELMLTSGLSDADFDKESLPEDTKEAPSKDDFDSEFNAEDTGAIKQLLDTVKKPETVVRSAWSNSSARRYLLDNVDAYRAKDEEQNMEEVIEKMYGGTVKGKLLPGKFIKENILFSFLVLLLLFLIGWKGAGMLFPDVMPDINDQIIKTVQKTTTGKSKDTAKEEKKPIVTDTANKKVIEDKLSHCLISADARNQFITAFAAVGFGYSDSKLTLSYEEISASIDVWQGMNMDYYLKDSILRSRLLKSLSLPVILDAHKAVSDYNQSLIDIKSQANKLESRIRNIQTAGGNQSTGTINERIPLRNELNTLEARIAEEPDTERFTELLAQLTQVEKILSGEAQSKRINRDEDLDSGQDWLVKLADTDSAEIGKAIEDVIPSSIQKPVDKLKQVTPKLTGFYLSELEVALNDVLNLAALISYIPENRLKSYKLELTGLNRRLNKLMKNELPVWIGVDQCLSQKRTEILSHLD